MAKCITVQTNYKGNDGVMYDRQVTLWINKDNTVTLLGGINHGHEIVITQELVNSLQEYLNQVSKQAESQS